MKLYMGKQLKISGDVMASQKLMFLKKIDPAQAAEVVAKLRAAGGGGGGGGGAAAAAPSGEPTSAEAFAVIGDYIGKNAGMVKEVGKTFLFKLSNPDSAYTIDLKNGNGSVTPGGTAGDCILEMSDSDFKDMVAGKADAMKLYMGKQLKISGDIMASQKLMFLKKIDPKQAAEVVAKLRSGGAAQPAAAAATGAAPAAKKDAAAPAIMKALGDKLAKDKSAGKDVGASIHLKVSDIGKTWTIDFKSGSIEEGAKAGVAATFTLDDETLVALTKGENVQNLFQRGKLRVDGDVRPAHHLEVFKGLA
jgi:3-hydroxyacyl-CoA dehydrogenase/3a,7a,12a-trihydroxy-5b-cholest-24-enoyl-CoA hydratase